MVENVGINPTRAGLFEILKQMGGDISFENQGELLAVNRLPTCMSDIVN